MLSQSKEFCGIIYLLWITYRLRIHHKPKNNPNNSTSVLWCAGGELVTYLVQRLVGQPRVGDGHVAGVRAQSDSRFQGLLAHVLRRGSETGQAQFGRSAERQGAESYACAM